jgi:hypothetical protein
MGLLKLRYLHDTYLLLPRALNKLGRDLHASFEVALL